MSEIRPQSELDGSTTQLAIYSSFDDSSRPPHAEGEFGSPLSTASLRCGRSASRVHGASCQRRSDLRAHCKVIGPDTAPDVAADALAVRIK
jgi:hypothetical protein